MFAGMEAAGSHWLQFNLLQPLTACQYSFDIGIEALRLQVDNNFF